MGYADWHFFWKDFEKNKGFRRLFLLVAVALLCLFMLPIVVDKFYEFQHKDEIEFSNQIALEWVRYLKNENKLKEMPEVTWELCDEFDSFLAGKMNNMEKGKEYDYLDIIRKAYADYKSIRTQYDINLIEQKTCEYFADNATELDKELNRTKKDEVRNPYYFFLVGNGVAPFYLRFEPLSSKCL